MNRQRGFATILMYGLLALAILGALGGIYGYGYSAGKDAKQAQWDEANRKAQDRADQERREREAAARAASEARQRAERDAADYRARWRAASAKQPVLASCGPAEPAGAVPAVHERPNAPDRADGGLRLTPAFVLLYDAAWTDANGKPLFGDPGGPVGEAAAATPAELLRVHEENAARCSATSRQLNALIDLIERLRNR